MSVLLQADDLERAYPVRLGFGGLWHRGPKPMVRALAGVSVQLVRGETLAVVGESGCGKSTLARALVRLITLDSGQIIYGGEDVRALRGETLRQYNRQVQMVFQDPYGSLNPRMTAGEMLGEVLRVHRIVPKAAVAGRITELLALVGLPADAADRLPRAFSGGQRQRLAIARALAVEPAVLIADEIVSALDVSIQAQILNLLLDMQSQLGLAMLFVSHDLRVVRHLAHQVAVMYLGRVVEHGTADAVFERPQHPYTQALLRAAPVLTPQRRTTESALQGELPSPMRAVPGCPFHPRCPKVFDRCRTEPPALLVRDGHAAACHLMDGT
ncbi:MAG: ABC transporter ATP-binding protein [Janthinobacterium lividum]